MTDLAEPEPPFAQEIFGPTIDTIREFTTNLLSKGEQRGLIGPKERERIWTRHITNCGLLAPLLSSKSRVADVGSGAGLPGIILAISRPDVQLILIEPMERRAQWLQEQVQVLGLENVDVTRARAEDCTTLQADAVTARAVSALRSLIPIAAPLVRDGGTLLLMKGKGAAQELLSAKKEVARFQLRNVEVVTLGGDGRGEPTWVVRARVDGSAREETVSRETF